MLDRENESNGDNFFKGDGDGVRHSDGKFESGGCRLSGCMK